MRHQQITDGIAAAYSPNEPAPLAGYATLLGIWTVGTATFLGVFADRLPRRVSWSDFALMSVATHKLARIVTKDFVTSPLRAPFVRYEKSAGSGEVEEKARGQGLRRAVGELATCNYCIAPWIAVALGAGFVVAPKVTRFLSALFGAVAVSDTLQHLYAAAKRLDR